MQPQLASVVQKLHICCFSQDWQFDTKSVLILCKIAWILFADRTKFSKTNKSKVRCSVFYVWANGQVILTGSFDVASGLLVATCHCYARGVNVFSNVLLSFVFEGISTIMFVWRPSISYVLGRGVSEVWGGAQEIVLCRVRLCACAVWMSSEIGLKKCGRPIRLFSLTQGGFPISLPFLQPLTQLQLALWVISIGPTECFCQPSFKKLHVRFLSFANLIWKTFQIQQECQNAKQWLIV